MLLKGLEEVPAPPIRAAAAEMVLIRLAFTADLPAPADIIDALGGVQRAGSRPAATDKAEKRPPVGTPVDLIEPPAEEADLSNDDVGPTSLQQPPLPILRSFADVVAAAGERREAKLKVHLEEQEPGAFRSGPSIDLTSWRWRPMFANELREKLNVWTGRALDGRLEQEPGRAADGEVERERVAAEVRDLEKHPAVAAVLRQFPDAEITSVRPLSGTEDTGTG